MQCLPGSKKGKEKRRARDEALKEARDKARVEEEERQAVGDKCDKRQWQDMQFEQFLDYKRKSVKHILGTLSFHFLTHFFLCMYTVIMVYQRLFTPLNCTLILDIHLYVLTQARPTMIYIH